MTRRRFILTALEGALSCASIMAAVIAPIIVGIQLGNAVGNEWVGMAVCVGLYCSAIGVAVACAAAYFERVK